MTPGAVILTDTNVTKALALTKIGLHVFPVSPISKLPLTPHGHLDASDDAEAVATMWGEFPDGRVGVHMGASGLVCLDVDIRPDKSGLSSLELLWIDPDTFNYDTPSGGKHYLYSAGDTVLSPKHEYKSLPGIDRKSSSSYAIFYGSEIPESRDVFKPVPEWLTEDAGPNTVGSAFEGGLADWLDGLDPAEPSQRVLGAIERIPSGEFSHPEMVERIFEFVRLAAEGNTGVRYGLEILRDAWLTPPWDSPDFQYEFDAALYGAIKKTGDLDEALKNLPNYLQVLDAHDGEIKESIYYGDAKDKRNYFTAIRTLVATTLTDDEIASVIWHAGPTKNVARDFGLSYLYEQITKARSGIVEPGPNPVPKIVENSRSKIALLSDRERLVVDACPTFIEHYLTLAHDKYPLYNEPYHRANAWTVLSLAFGMYAFVPLSENEKLGVNLFQINLGASSSGKSQSLSFRDAITDEFFANDPEFDLGANLSKEYLHEKLIERDGKVSFLNADEAARFFQQLSMRDNYAAGLDTELTNYYGGKVPPVGKKGSKDISGKRALVSFHVGFFGTPRRVNSYLTTEQFDDGFLARFIWTYGDDIKPVSAEITESQALAAIAVAEFDPKARAMATGLASMRKLIGGGRHPVLGDDETLRRIGKCRDQMLEVIKGHPREDILTPSVRRLGDNIRKATALIALTRGSTRFSMEDALYCIGSAEQWLTDLIRAAEEISGSIFQREADAIANYIAKLGGKVTKSKLAYVNNRFDPREYGARMQSLVEQGRVVSSRDDKFWEINTKEEEE